MKQCKNAPLRALLSVSMIMNHDHHGISLKVFQILLVTSATLVVTGALLVVTKKLLEFNSFFVTTSKAPVTTSVALVSTCFLFSHSAHSGPAWYAALSLTIWAARLGSPGRRSGPRAERVIGSAGLGSKGTWTRLDGVCSKARSR